MDGIAIIGLAGRFPGAKDVPAFWDNLKNGVESITRFTDAELELTPPAGEGPIVNARGVLEGADLFDAGFFGINPRDAEQMDPQQRVFLECAWEALENAGYDPAKIPGLVGVWAGASLNSYLLYNLCADRAYIERLVSGYQQGGPADFLGNEKDFLATRVSYKLDLRGPSLTVQTACSTSLVAISQACQALLNYQADVALAGGVSITFPQRRAYPYVEGAMASADGHTRAFDADAAGTVFSSGAGVVVLKRLDDAVADRDDIVAVIRGSAVNNDGAGKVSYTAPSVDGQAEVILLAQTLAGVTPDQISYVETHGTGTPLGDPIELAGLTQAFRAGGSTRNGFCAIGSLKTNVGHLETASGVAAVIKTALALRHRQIPPSLHFRSPNPKLDLPNTPFRVADRLLDWPSEGPRRAGVSSFGVGGTNAHAILEEGPAPEPSAPSPRAEQLLVLSARSAAALDAAAANLATHLAAHPDLDLADVAYTLQAGRREFTHRRAFLASAPIRAVTAVTQNAPSVVFLFPGQGAQFAGMGAGLYAGEPVFRAEVDRCAGLLGSDPLQAADLDQTQTTQPALFVFGYALAKLWMSWGIQPAAMLGHSVGEYVAACLAGVFLLEDALMLVATRARLVQALPPGAMLAARLPEAELAALLPAGVSIAAINSPGLCVASGAAEDIAALEAALDARKIPAKRLRTSHAFHSAMMDPAVAPFLELVRGLSLRAPTIPFVSNVTGRPITDAQATDPRYWASHLRGAVRFADGVATLAADPARIFLEVGPGQTLTPLVRQQGAAGVASLVEKQDDGAAILLALGRLWTAGVAVDWNAFHAAPRRRVPLPAYPFERQRCWVEAPESGPAPATPGRPMPAPALPVERQPALIARLRVILKNLSGQDQSASDPETSFLELGFDSLFLTQVAGAFRKEFNVKVTFRQLLEDFPTMAALAAHLDAQLPAEKPAPAPAPAAEPAAPGSTLERVIAEQLRVMEQQLAMLRGGAAPAPKSHEKNEGEGNHASHLSPSSPPAPPKAFGPYRPIEKGPGGGFTGRQQTALDALSARYLARTPGSKRLTQASRPHFADPRSVSGFRPSWKEIVYPIVVERSAGARLWDVDGNEYIDLTMGFGTNLLGHAPAFVKKAIEAQLALGMEVGPQSPLAGKVAGLLCELTGSERAAFTNTGSEAVLAAVRLARTVTGRTRLATCGGFHGINDEVLVRANTVDGVRRSVPVAPGIPEHIVKDVLVIDWGTPAGLELLRAHAHELAALLVEPVQSRRPDLQPREFLHEVRRITAEAGCALIFDEVITGFRAAPGGAQEYFGVQADLATWGKIMGGGLPVGAVTGKAEYMDALDGGAWQYGDASFPEVGVTFFAGTYIRHPLTLAASWAVLSYLKQQGPGLQRELNARTRSMVDELNVFFVESGVPLRLENFASLFYPHFDDDIKHGSLLYFALRERGIHVWEGRPCFLSTAHTADDVRQIVRAFQESTRELQLGGFLPGEPLELEAPEMGRDGKNGSEGTDSSPSVPVGALPLAFSLYYFGNYPAEYRDDKYRLVIEGAKFADRHGFSAVWLPERHFHAVGGFSPNPSLLAAALARETTRLQLRGGSVVLPLHHPVRVAEEWSLVDNLSHGRAGISIASGWHPNDFIFAPERFERRREICLEDIETIQRLWRGETLPLRAGAGSDFDVKLFPLPVQPTLPAWLTCIHEDSFVKAGELGMGVLGYLMNQTVEEVAGKIAKYREALARAGHDPAKGHVTILVHTFLGADAEAARETARKPLTDYLRSFLDNSQKRLESQTGPVEVAEEDVDYLLEKSFNDYVQGKALIGSPDSCAAVVDRLRDIGVDEIGCFVDFGVSATDALAALPALDQLRARYAGSERRETQRPEGEETRGEEQRLALTESQSGLWVLGQTDRDALRAYNESTTLEWKGPLDVDALRAALQKLVDRHDALRTSIAPDGETQIVHPRVTLEAPLREISGDLEAAFREIEQAEFDFAKGPLVRAQILRLAAEHHLLVLTFHHLLGNGPSYWVFFDELTSLLDGAKLEPPMQLARFAAQANPQNADDEAFWLAQFQGAPPALELPADRPRPPLRTHRGARQSLTLGAELTASLRKIAAAKRGSLFMLLLTTFQTLLHRLSGQDDVTVGVPYEGDIRSQPGGDRLFANTTNVVPLRSRAAQTATFADLFGATKTLVLDAHDRQNYFFGRLIKKLGLAPDASRPPIFAAFFNYESGKFERSLADGRLRVALKTDEGVPYRSPRDTAMFELYLNVAEKDGALHCECDGAADLFDGATVARWLRHYQTLLEAISAGGAETNLWDLPLLTAAERQTMLVDWNRTAADYPLDLPLHELIDAQARRTPDAVALTFENASLTYDQVRRRANGLAHALLAHGVGRGSLVGVCLERSFEIAIGLLAVLKTGAAYVPLDPEYPADRLAFIIGDIGAAAVLTQERWQGKLPAREGCAIIALDEFAPEAGEAPPAGARPDDPAYVIFTSGSTGQPKGVVNTHRNICNRLHWKQAAHPLTPADRLLQKTPFTFDVSVPEFFAPLLAGATMVIARPHGHMDSDYLARLIEERGVTDIHFVPAMLAVFLEEKDLAARCRTLRRVTCSGEALPGELAARFFETFREGVELLNLYGPTEAAVEVTSHPCRPEDGAGPVPIGRPIANTQTYVLDRRGQPAPIGVPGELLLGGANVAAGYLGRPELTAEKFIPDPFTGHGRLYRTGDLVRYRPDGEIVYLGRMDHQVKIRGFRIELGEIETLLNAHPAVRESVVLAREDRPGDRRLAAYLVADRRDPDFTAELREHLRAKLPEYMTPAAFVYLDALPVNANGKIDRRALPAPEYTAPATGFAPPRTALERTLARHWQELLAVEQVGLHDNFFELGGDSLLGLRLVNRLRDELAEHVSLVVVFEAPTVAGLAVLLERNYAAGVARLCGAPAPVAAAPVEARLTEDDVQRMRTIVGHVRSVAISALAPGDAKNPPAVFILSPMRSGSTLLRIMLAGHPQLFSPPELQLLQFDSLKERSAAFTGYERYMQEGTVRAIMQIRQCDLDAAQEVMEEMEDSATSVRHFYRQMQDWVDPRMLVDKTPDYAMDVDVLRRAEAYFEGALYVHLARHPLGMIRSYEKGRFLLESPYRGRHDFSARQLAELTWLISHQNIAEFLRGIPAERQHRVRFEDLTSSPRVEMEALAGFLGVAYDPAMAQPYENQAARMTDGVHAMSPQVGDFNYQLHGELKADVAGRWKTEYTRDFLGEATWDMAAQLGYENPFAQAAPTPGLPAIVAVSREGRRMKRSALAE